jgi:hypothetical protein
MTRLAHAGLAALMLCLVPHAATAAEPADAANEPKRDWRSIQPGIRPRDPMAPSAAPATPPRPAPAPSTPAVTGPRGQVLEYGYYKIEAEGNQYPDPSAPSGAVQAGATVKLVELTDRIPIEKGRLFGFRFRVTGIDTQESVEVREVVTHPPMTKPDGTVSTQYETTVGLNVRLGEVSDYAGYRLDHGYELVEGEWKFEFWLGDKKLLEQKFTTVSNRTRAKTKPKAAG